MTIKRSYAISLGLLAAGLVINIGLRFTGSSGDVVTGVDSRSLLEKRLNSLRLSASTVPAKSDVLKTVDAQLLTREKAIMSMTTAPQAQARLLEVVRRIASANKIEARGADFAPPSLLGVDYGEVAVSVLFECKIEDFVNFLADLSKEPELIAPSEVHISAGNPKSKTINVRMTLAGVVAKKLVPEKKGFGVL